MEYTISPVSQSMRAALQEKMDHKTKPPGSLGRLEKLAIQVGMIQHSLTPALINPTILIFAADHGIAVEGVSKYPQEVTWQMVLNFLNGGGAVNILAAQNKMSLKIIDAGVNYRFKPSPFLLDYKIDFGTKNFLYEAAMTSAQLDQCFRHGSTIVSALADREVNVLGFGEMGIGNTSSSAILMSLLCKIPLRDCVGAGTGLAGEGILKKMGVLQQCIERAGVLSDPVDLLQQFGGFEIAMMCGAMLEAASRSITRLIDGFISTTALLVAASLYPSIVDYCIFSHCSEEKGHQRLLQHLGAGALLNLNMRLGEGSGVATAYPLLASAVAVLNDMASFTSAGVSSAVK